MSARRRLLLVLTVLLALGCFGPRRGLGSALPNPANELADILTQDVIRFKGLLASRTPERRIEGVLGLSHLKHWPAENELIGLLDDASPGVRRETVLALGRLGTAKSVPRLIGLLGDPSWELRQNAWLGLCRMTAQHFAADQEHSWEKWWQASGLADKERALLAALMPSARERTEGPSRRDALRALRHLASASAEDALLDCLRKPQTPPLDADEHAFIAEALERIGTTNSVRALAPQRSDAAAWALGRIGGADAEQALLSFPKTLATLLALDRLHSTNAGPFIPFLVNSFGLVTYRGQPDDLMDEDAQPIQRIAANLILRSGGAPRLAELVVQELEDSMKPPIAHGPRPPAPPSWTTMLEAMREELKPGFVRGDGLTTSQPLTALSHLAASPALGSRLIPLLRHPAFVPRIYVAMTLGKLHALEAVPALVEIIRESYAFSDPTALASGKHFDQSQTVRWRGFLGLALGRLGGDEARRSLEDFAADAQRPRDVRYGSVVGLGFIASPQSLPVLERVAHEDIIWMVRDAARRAVESIQNLPREARR